MLDWAARDQALRLGPLDPAAWAAFDAEATDLLRQVLREHGWPGRLLVGADGAQAAWLLVQHSPDLAFQEQVLDILLAARPEEVEPVYAAYRHDRICIRRGRAQRYGTQVGPGGQPFPIEGAQEVDVRRRSVGLGPLAADLASFAPEGGPRSG